jgi:outer membrane protein assembly factor BamA
VWIEPAAADTGKIEKLLKVRVRERPGGLVDFRLGYAALDGATIGAEVVNRNIQGQAIEAGISGGFGERVREVEVSVGDPWFTGRRIGIKALGHYAWNDEISLETDGEDVSLITETAGAGFVLTRRLGRAVTVEGGYAIEWMGSKLVVTSKDEADTTRTSTWTSDISGAVMYDTRDDILDARRGMLARAWSRFASSKLGGTNNFSQYELSWRGFKDIRHGRTIALTARVGWIKLQGKGGAPITERYFAGGEGSVRGFERNALSPVGEDGEPLGGLALVELRAEVRFPIYKRLGAAAFVDAGQAYEDFRAIALDDLAVGAGGGLRFRTDFGVLRLDVATPVSEKGDPQYYFGIGQAF